MSEKSFQASSAPADPAAQAAPGTVTVTFEVVGMTCGHCVSAVTKELTDAFPGVKDVQIDLPTGRVLMTADQRPDEVAIAAAVDEAGYQLAAGTVR